LLERLPILQHMHLLQLYWSHLLVLLALLSGMTKFKLHFCASTLCKFWFVMLSCSAALAHIILRERLHIFGVLGCVLCVVGSTTIVLHAPQEREIESVPEVWDLAMDPGSHVSISTLKC
jgi:hypothetical protein